MVQDRKFYAQLAKWILSVGLLQKKKKKIDSSRYFVKETRAREICFGRNIVGFMKQRRSASSINRKLRFNRHSIISISGTASHPLANFPRVVSQLRREERERDNIPENNTCRSIYIYTHTYIYRLSTKRRSTLARARAHIYFCYI